MQAKDDQMLAALLLLIAEMLDVSVAKDLSTDQRTCLSHFTQSIIARRLKARN